MHWGRKNNVKERESLGCELQPEMADARRQTTARKRKRKRFRNPKAEEERS